MIKEEFQIGVEFYSGNKKWRCTDIGTRTIGAICLSDFENDPSWLNGPPYACAETLNLAYKWTCSLEHSAKIAYLENKLKNSS